MARRRLVLRRPLLVAGLAGMSLFSANAQAQLSGSLGIHDPSTVMKHGGKFYLFGTGQGIISKQSNDHFAWSAGPRVFPPASPPAWTTSAVPGFGGNFWAPDLAFFNNKYHLYYSISTFGSQTSAIGLVTNPTLDPTDPSYRWSDQGPVIQSAPGNNYNAIDAAIIQTTEGRVWMSFGSFWNGIYITELDPATGKRLAATTPPTRLADNSSIEASYIHKEGDYYYLFVNYGTCCQGVNSTYNIRVARSANITGPYLDRSGVGMINSGGGTPFLTSEEQYIGPGHFALFEDQGVQWFGYHYYNASANGAATYNLRTLQWPADGWPIAGPSMPVSPADLNFNGIVDFRDYRILIDNMKRTGATHADGDMNADTLVDYRDFHIWKAIYHEFSPTAGWALRIPEPAAGLLLLSGALGLIVVARRSRIVPLCGQF